jgi:acylphosphatase
MHPIEYQVIFTGKVQGVGFRQIVYSIALKYNLKGYVKNLQDGQVELRVFADEKILESLLDEIKVKARSAIITDIEILKKGFSSPFDNFTIKRD